MMHAEPQKEHNWLHRMIGSWTMVSECAMGPGEPTQKFHATETVRSLGGLWTIAEGTGEMPGGGTAYTIMTLGYDPASSSFVGSFVGSMMTHFWIYRGSLDPAGKVLTLDAEGPNFTTGAITKYQDIIEIVSDDLRTLKSQSLGEDGKWVQFMSAEYRRVK